MYGSTMTTTAYPPTPQRGHDEVDVEPRLITASQSVTARFRTRSFLGAANLIIYG